VHNVTQSQNKPRRYDRAAIILFL